MILYNFLKERISRKDYIFTSQEVSPYIRKGLLDNGYATYVYRWIYIIKERETTILKSYKDNLPPLLSKIEGIVSGDVVLNYYLGKKITDAKEIIVYTQSINHSKDYGEGNSITFRKSNVYRSTKVIKINGYNILSEDLISYLINNIKIVTLLEIDVLRKLLIQLKIGKSEIDDLISKGVKISWLSKLGLLFLRIWDKQNYEFIKKRISENNRVFNFNTTITKKPVPKPLKKVLQDKKTKDIAKLDKLFSKK
jgi:hypothetical protein